MWWMFAALLSFLAVVMPGQQNVTLNVDPSTWFGGSGTARLDPSVAGNKSAIENNIQSSMKLFEDNDHNGMDDSTQH